MEISGAERSCRFNKFTFAHGQNLRAHQASVADPSSDGEGEYEIENSWTAEGHEGDCDENAGEGKKCVHQHDVDEAIDASTIVSGKAADDEAKKERTHNHAAADEERNSRSPNQAGEDVTSKLIGTAPMLR